MPYHATDWQTQNHGMFAALALEKLGMGLVIFFIMIVAAFNIVGTLTMLVTDKTREIGILQAMGLPAGSIGRIFLAQGAIIGGDRRRPSAWWPGLVVGFVIDRSGWVRIDPSIYFIDRLPVGIELTDVLVVTAGGPAGRGGGHPLSLALRDPAHAGGRDPPRMSVVLEARASAEALPRRRRIADRRARRAWT